MYVTILADLLLPAVISALVGYLAVAQSVWVDQVTVWAILFLVWWAFSIYEPRRGWR